MTDIIIQDVAQVIAFTDALNKVSEILKTPDGILATERVKNAQEIIMQAEMVINEKVAAKDMVAKAEKRGAELDAAEADYTDRVGKLKIGEAKLASAQEQLKIDQQTVLDTQNEADRTLNEAKQMLADAQKSKADLSKAISIQENKNAEVERLRVSLQDRLDKLSNV